MPTSHIAQLKPLKILLSNIPKNCSHNTYFNLNITTFISREIILLPSFHTLHIPHILNSTPPLCLLPLTSCTYFLILVHIITNINIVIIRARHHQQAFCRLNSLAYTHLLNIAPTVLLTRLVSFCLYFLFNNNFVYNFYMSHECHSMNNNNKQLQYNNNNNINRQESQLNSILTVPHCCCLYAPYDMRPSNNKHTHTYTPTLCCVYRQQTMWHIAISSFAHLVSVFVCLW